MKVLRKNGRIAEVSFEETEGKKAFWHTGAYVPAQGVRRLYRKQISSIIIADHRRCTGLYPETDKQGMGVMSLAEMVRLVKRGDAE